MRGKMVVCSPLHLTVYKSEMINSAQKRFTAFDYLATKLFCASGVL